MRFFLAGLLIGVFPIAAFAQAKGQVLSVGFNNYYRPDCWTPMLIQLTSESPDATEYQIQIVQEDLDKDKVVYTQQVTLGGNVEGHSANSDPFWVYFRPKPTDGGLPDASAMGSTLNDLNKELKVFLCNKDGTKQIAVLPNTATIRNIDPKRPTGDDSRDCKLILMVTDSGLDKPIMRYDPTDKQHGTLEDAIIIPVQPRDLPNNVLGYEGVDAIVWMDADAGAISGGTRGPVLDAIHQYVHQGGHLVVTEPAESFKVKPFADMLPVTSVSKGDDWTIPTIDCKDNDIDDPAHPIPHPMAILRRLAHGTRGDDLPWKRLSGNFKVGRAIPTADAKVDEWIEWDGQDSTFHTPWLARRAVGLGACTWVAQDLGNPAITEHNKVGWRFVWDRVFGWNNYYVPENYQPPADKVDPWQPSNGIDLGLPFLKGMDLTNTAVYLVSLACFFFVVYWLAAGPGVYLFLAAKKKAHLSWFWFGAAAIIATGITFILVKAVVRGPPQLRHMSNIRYADGEPEGIIRSRFGLYIPQDGFKAIEVHDTSDHTVSYIAPFGMNPQYVANDDSFPAYQQYYIPVRDPNDAAPLEVSIPYRSTSKKLETEWTGELKNKLELANGSKMRLVDTPQRIDGTLVNHTGYDLQGIYVAYKAPWSVERDASTSDDVWMIYVPSWPKDGELRFKDLLTNQNIMNPDKRQPGGNDVAFERVRPGVGWDLYWQKTKENVANDLNLALPMLTIFDDVPPKKMTADYSRFELYRRNARFLNLTPALNAGQLVVAGTISVGGDVSKTPLPFPLTVSGSLVAGQGTTIVQAVFPIDRSQMYLSPTTRPVTPPTTKP